jgi:hypothetical protein
MIMGNDIIREIDNKITELKTQIDTLERAKAVLIGTVDKVRHFFVASRSGGSGHTLAVYQDGTVVCGCEAGRVGRNCWVKRAFDTILGFKSPEEITDRGRFFDEKFAKHYWKEVN